MHLSQISSLGFEDINHCDALIEPRYQATILLRIARAECAQKPRCPLLVAANLHQCRAEFCQPRNWDDQASQSPCIFTRAVTGIVPGRREHIEACGRKEPRVIYQSVQEWFNCDHFATRGTPLDIQRPSYLLQVDYWTLRDLVRLSSGGPGRSPTCDLRV